MTSVLIAPREIDHVIDRAMRIGLSGHWLAGRLGIPYTGRHGTAQWAAYRLGATGITVTARRVLTAITTGRHRRGRHRKENRTP